MMTVQAAVQELMEEKQYQTKGLKVRANNAEKEIGKSQGARDSRGDGEKKRV